MRNNKLAALTLIALAASASTAFAQSGQYGEALATTGTPFVSQLTRAEVQASVKQSATPFAQGEVGVVASAPLTGTLSRADVRADARQANARGAIAHGEAAVATVATAARTTLGFNSLTRPYLSGGQAFLNSGEAYVAEAAPFVSTRSREDVRAEARQAVAHGDVLVGEVSGSTPAATGGRTRAEVIAELQQARANGELFVGESYAANGQTARHL